MIFMKINKKLIKIASQGLRKLSFSLFLVFLVGCTYKKEILYFQHAAELNQKIQYPSISIQPNDILSISISALIPETAIVYNRQIASDGGGSQSNTSIELMKLQGYLVKTNGDITLPVLGKINTHGKTIQDLEQYIIQVLEKGNHLVDPSVDVRLLNAKFTVMGEVNNPGTFTYTEQVVTIPQAIGYAGDLTIHGKRKNILLIRENDGNRLTYQIDLTQTNWINNETYYIRPNDVLVVNPNQAKVKSAGYIGSISSLIGVISLLITTTILLKN